MLDRKPYPYRVMPRGFEFPYSRPLVPSTALGSFESQPDELSDQHSGFWATT